MKQYQNLKHIKLQSISKNKKPTKKFKNKKHFNIGYKIKIKIKLKMSS